MHATGERPRELRWYHAAGMLFGVFFGQTQFNGGFLPGIKAFTAAVLGGINNNPNNHQAFPAVSFANDNYSGWDSTKNWNEWHDNGSLNDSLVWIHRAHSFKFGYIYEHLQVSQQATKAWIFRFTRAGVPRKMGLGPVSVKPDDKRITLADARQKAAAARSLLIDGIDPIAALRAE